ncbi:MAG TPA: YceI family protein [Rhizomicrobium sp.]|nr:YceI family protein [Rhizomicrobium sp.]
MRGLLAALVLTLAASPAWAAHWNVDYGRSRLSFAVSWSGQPFTAAFRTWKADIAFDPADLAHSRAGVTIDIASEASADSETDSAVKGAEGMAADRFPQARFVTTGFRFKGGNTYVATGTLSLHGVTRPVVLPFNLVVAGNIAHMTGAATVLRTDFGIGGAAADAVAREVTVNVDLWATKA